MAVHAAGWGRLKLGGFQPAPQWVDGTAALSLCPSAPHARHPCHHGGVHGRGTVSRHSLRAFSESRCRAEGEESATLGARCRKGCTDISASTWKMSRQGAHLALTVLVGEGKL